MVSLVTSEICMRNSKNSPLGACSQRKRINSSSSCSSISASSVLPFQEKEKTLSLKSTLSANHSCKPAGVERNSYKILGEHRTGYSNSYCTFLDIAQVISKSISSGCNYRKIFILSK